MPYPSPYTRAIKRRVYGTASGAVRGAWAPWISINKPTYHYCGSLTLSVLAPEVTPPYPCESVVSEFDSELELENARQVRLSGGPAEIGVRNVRIDASQTNIIEQVVRIGPKHKP